MLDRDFHCRTARPQQELANFGIGLALHRLSVDRRNAIAEAQAGAMGRSFREGGANVRIYVSAMPTVFYRGSDTEVFRPLFGAERCVSGRVEVGRVRVEYAQHAHKR